jgi:hypothetical protein
VLGPRIDGWAEKYVLLVTDARINHITKILSGARLMACSGSDEQVDDDRLCSSTGFLGLGDDGEFSDPRHRSSRPRNGSELSMAPCGVSPRSRARTQTPTEGGDEGMHLECALGSWWQDRLDGEAAFQAHTTHWNRAGDGGERHLAALGTADSDGPTVCSGNRVRRFKLPHDPAFAAKLRRRRAGSRPARL